MPEYVDPAIEELRGSSASISVTLLIGASGDRDELRAALSKFDVTIDDSIGRTALLVRSPEAAVDQLCDLEAASSIELDHEDIEVRRDVLTDAVLGPG